jgi:hypothetical protein
MLNCLTKNITRMERMNITSKVFIEKMFDSEDGSGENHGELTPPVQGDKPLTDSQAIQKPSQES